MRLTLHTDHGLRALIYLALTDAEWTPTREIAERYQISRNNLTKIIRRLDRAGLVATTPGRHGGVQLACPPARINLADVVERLEPGFALVECMNDPSACAITPACRLRGLLAEARDAFLAVLRRHTLADILTHPAALRRLLSLDDLLDAATEPPTP